MLLLWTLVFNVHALINIYAMPASSGPLHAQEVLLHNRLLEKFKNQTGITAKFIYAAVSQSSQYSGLVHDYLRRRSDEIDIFMIDVVWPTDFATDLIDLLEYDNLQNSIGTHNPSIALNNMVDGRLVALPLLLIMASCFIEKIYF